MIDPKVPDALRAEIAELTKLLHFEKASNEIFQKESVELQSKLECAREALGQIVTREGDFPYAKDVRRTAREAFVKIQDASGPDTSSRIEKLERALRRACVLARTCDGARDQSWSSESLSRRHCDDCANDFRKIRHMLSDVLVESSKLMANGALHCPICALRKHSYVPGRG